MPRDNELLFDLDIAEQLFTEHQELFAAEIGPDPAKKIFLTFYGPSIPAPVEETNQAQDIGILQNVFANIANFFRPSSSIETAEQPPMSRSDFKFLINEAQYIIASDLTEGDIRFSDVELQASPYQILQTKHFEVSPGVIYVL